MARVLAIASVCGIAAATYRWGLGMLSIGLAGFCLAWGLLRLAAALGAIAEWYRSNTLAYGALIHRFGAATLWGALFIGSAVYLADVSRVLG